MFLFIAGVESWSNMEFKGLASIKNIQLAFKIRAEKFLLDGYMDCSELISAGITKDSALLDLKGSKYHVLYAKYAFDCRKKSTKEIERDALEFWRNSVGDDTDDNMTVLEAEYIIAWVMRVFTNRYVNTTPSFAIWKEILEKSTYFKSDVSDEERDIHRNGNIIYDAQRVELDSVAGLSAYVSKMLTWKRNLNPDMELFYRGHSKVNYLLIPSILRRDKDSLQYSLLKRENELYSEIQYRCPSDFKSCKSHLEKLTIMQHYGIPTRLLDITTNPLVALYFACVNSGGTGELIVLQEKKSNVKWPESDTASILSSLANMPLSVKDEIANEAKKILNESKTNLKKRKDGSHVLDEKKNNVNVQKLLTEIRTEKPGFFDGIRAEDIGKKQFVHAALNNQRIVHQSGLFILFGHSCANNGQESERRITWDDTANEFRLKDKSGKIKVLLISNKQKILQELSAMGIDEAKLFPEIEDVARTIVKKINNSGQLSSDSW